MRIVLADDAALLREGLAGLMTAAGHEVVAQACDAPELVETVTALGGSGELPDVVVTDVRMPPTRTDDGLRAALDLRSRFPGLPVVVLSAYIAGAYVRDLLADDAGGVGYLLKERVGRVADFMRSLEVVRSGGVVVDPEVVSRLLGPLRPRHDGGPGAEGVGADAGGVGAGTSGAGAGGVVTDAGEPGAGTSGAGAGLGGPEAGGRSARGPRGSGGLRGAGDTAGTGGAAGAGPGGGAGGGARASAGGGTRARRLGSRPASPSPQGAVPAAHTSASLPAGHPPQGVVDREAAAASVLTKRLTARERQVLALMAEGASNPQVAARLYVSEGAVAKHVASIFLKLDLPPGEENRRVRAILTWLRAST